MSLKKIPPKKFPEVKEVRRPFYGEYITTCRNARGKKTNMICQDPDCGYSSRVFINTFSEDKRDYVASYHCPIHNTPLINIGCGAKMPKKGSKQRKQLIKKYIK